MAIAQMHAHYQTLCQSKQPAPMLQAPRSATTSLGSGTASVTATATASASSEQLPHADLDQLHTLDADLPSSPYAASTGPSLPDSLYSSRSSDDDWTAVPARHSKKTADVFKPHVQHYNVVGAPGSAEYKPFHDRHNRPEMTIMTKPADVEVRCPLTCCSITGCCRHLTKSAPCWQCRFVH